MGDGGRPERINHPNDVRCRPFLDDYARFEAARFGITRRVSYARRPSPIITWERPPDYRVRVFTALPPREHARLRTPFVREVDPRPLDP